MYFSKLDKQTINDLAIASLNETLYAFKPGLTDGNDKIANEYKKGIEFLNATFGDFFMSGREYSCVESGLCFDSIRIKSKVLENKLINYTNDVHTHVGAMFSLGLMSAAAGKLDALGIKFELEYLIVTVADFARYNCYKAFSNLNLKTTDFTDGEKLYLKTGQTSMRGIAEEGFRPVLTKGLELLYNNGNDKNEQNTRLYLLLVSILDDSRIILNFGDEVMKDVRFRAVKLNENYSVNGAKEFDTYLRSKNIEPRAAMAMHSLCLFTHKLLNI